MLARNIPRNFFLLSQQRDAFLLSGIAQVVIKRGQGKGEAQGKFEVCGVVDCEAVIVGEGEGFVPNVFAAFGVFENWHAGQVS